MNDNQETLDVTKASPLSRGLQIAIGSISGASLGAAVGVGVQMSGLYQYWSVCVALGSALGILAGFVVSWRLTTVAVVDPDHPYRGQVLEAIVATYHLGAVVLFVALIGWGFRGFYGWSDVNQRMLLEMIVLGYGFLRLWILVHRLWVQAFGTEPLFFVGLYLGTFPALLSGFRETEALSSVAWIFHPLRQILAAPGIAADLFHSFWMNWFRELCLWILATSLGWAFVFLVIDLLLKRRALKKQTVA